MQLTDFKNKLIEWIDLLVCMKEELIEIKSSVMLYVKSPDHEINLNDVELCVDDIAIGENLIAIMRNEMGIIWKSLHTQWVDDVWDYQNKWIMYAEEMKLMEAWNLKLSTGIEILFHKEIRLAS